MKKYTIYTIMVLGVLFALSLNVSAEKGSSDGEARDRFEERREDSNDDRVTGIDDSRRRLSDDREQMLQAIQEKRDFFKSEFEARKAEMEKTREEMKAKFEAGLLKIKDADKKERIENIAKNIPELNIRITERFSKIVNSIEAALIAIESRTDKAAANDVDVTAVRTAIATAKTAIADARTAIATQIGKTYPIAITSETTAKSVIEATRNAFRADIKAVHAKVKAAHEATKKAAAALRAIKGVDDMDDSDGDDSGSEDSKTNIN
jgi:hypothetical protein